MTTYDHNFPSPQAEVKTFRLEPGSVTEVEDAFQTVTGFDWAVTVEGAQTVVHVDGDTWVHDTVMIPTEVCEEL